MVHNYIITEIEREISSGIINKVSFIIESHHEEIGERYNGEIEITGSIDAPDFIEFENVTKENVLNWITSRVDTTIIETENSASIANLTNLLSVPTTQTGLPWDQE